MRVLLVVCLALIGCNGTIVSSIDGGGGGSAAGGGGGSAAGGGGGGGSAAGGGGGSAVGGGGGSAAGGGGGSAVGGGGGSAADGGGGSAADGGDAGSGDAGSGNDAGPGDAGNNLLPDGGTPIRFYSSHLMVALIGHSKDMQAWVLELKAAGYNHIWAHMDDYGSYYVTNLQRLMDAAQVAGITVSPGIAGGMTAAKATQVIVDTYNHPAMLKLGGKRVYADYGHNKSQFNTVVSMLATAGIGRSTYLLLANTLYPIQNGATWIEYGTGTPADVNAVNHAYDIDPNIDGFIDFAVDKGTSDPATAIGRIVNENAVTTQAGSARGKLTMAGTNAFYASVQFTDLGFSGAAAIWQGILGSTVRPELVNDVTANDYIELSYMSPLENPAPNGLTYVPLADAGYVLGATARTPLLDHSGVQKFLRPWADAYLSGAAQPAFTADKMFAWYYLHPANAPVIATLPPAVAAISSVFDQTWWNGTVYATGNSPVGGQNQVTGIKTNFAAQMGKIRMAAHLTAPAQLAINGTLSAVLPAGAAYFEVPQTLGTPVFSIVRNGVTVMSGNGKQPITNSVWPGGWNCLATEVP